MPGNGSNDESDKDMGCVGDEDNSTRKRQTSNYACKPAEVSDRKGYLESVVVQVKKKDGPLKPRKGSHV